MITSDVARVITLVDCLHCKAARGQLCSNDRGRTWESSVHSARRTKARAAQKKIHAARPKRPTIVCLCGSTRFYPQFQEQNYLETMAGRIVLSVGFYPHAQQQMHGEEVGVTPEQKLALDELHKRKIELADEILVLNVGGYIGDSTRSEIEHARQLGRPIRWYSEPAQAVGA